MDLPKPAAPDFDLGPPILQRGDAALRLLIDAYYYAWTLDCSIWDFAEEIAGLRQCGLTNGDLRWLVFSGLAEHGDEVRDTAEEHRTFGRESELRFSANSCFVLTRAGATYFGEFLSAPNGTVLQVQPESTAASDATRRLTPTWDRDLQELRLGKELIKRFKVPAPNQETVLAVFQEENWPTFIDDPLPPHDKIDPKRRLHDTINSLNRNQRKNLIKFRGSGSGKGLRWECVAT
jgi:hypothetical protein